MWDGLPSPSKLLGSWPTDGFYKINSQPRSVREIPMRELLAELNHALAAGRDCVYCSVVETRGSTPQKAGAAMLVFPDGRQVGTLGGGCVEAEVKRQALTTLGGDGAGKTE